MIIPDKKKAVTAILSKMTEGDDKPSRTEVRPSIPVDGDESLHTIAEDAMSAFQNKSAGDLTQALKAFWAEMENRSKGE